MYDTFKVYIIRFMDMAMTMKKITLTAAITIGLGAASLAFAQPESQNATAVAPSTVEQSEIITTNAPVVKTARAASWNGKKVALRGRDVVSFHTNDKPLRGSKKFVADWDNTQWRFSSEENRDLFLKDPKKYVPEFGGYCPVSLARNHAKVGHVGQYTIRDEKLYMNYNRSTKSAFNESPDNFLLRAQLNF